MKTILPFLFLLSFLNCITHDSVLLNSSKYKSSTNLNKETIAIRNIEIIDYPDNQKAFFESMLKANLYNALTETETFQEVNYYKDSNTNAKVKIIDLKFKKYFNQLEVHPLYFPLATLTLTLYIWFGGPIVRYEADYTLEVNSYDSKGNKLKSATQNFKDSTNENIYSGFKARREIPSIRFNFILDSIRSVL